MVDWEKRYREGFYHGEDEPHHLLERFWKIIPQGVVIDIAAGRGRNTLFLAGKGYRVYGIDSSQEGLRIAREAMAKKTNQACLIRGDANNLPFKPGTAAGVVVFYFLLRHIMKELIDLLQKGGVLVYETFLKRQNLFGRQRNPDFLLGDGELLSFFTSLELILYEELVYHTEGNRRAVARFVGRKT